MSNQMRYFDANSFKKYVKDHEHAPSNSVVIKHFVADSIEKIHGDKGNGRVCRFTISTGAVDRDRDTIDPKGFDLKAYRKNPVVLFAHNNSEPPIAKAHDVWVEGGKKLKADAEFMGADLYPFADMIYRMIEQGYMKATSVGFVPTKYQFYEGEDEQRTGGVDFEEQSLIEFSVVPVPSNPEALVEEGPKKGIDTKQLASWYEQVMDEWSHYKDVLPIARSEAERITRALEGKQRTSRMFSLSRRQQDELLAKNLAAVKGDGNMAGEEETAPDEKGQVTKAEVGSFYEWDSSGGVARGRADEVKTEGSLEVPDANVTIDASEDDPAVLLTVYEEDGDGYSPTDTRVGHRASELRSIDPLPEPSEKGEVEESEESSYNGYDEDYEWDNHNEYGEGGDNENESDGASAEEQVPVIHGTVFETPAHVIDAEKQIYALSAGSLKSIDAVYDVNGTPLHMDKYSDLDAFVATKEFGTSCATLAEYGLVKLGSEVATPVSADVKGAEDQQDEKTQLAEAEEDVVEFEEGLEQKDTLAPERKGDTGSGDSPPRTAESKSNPAFSEPREGAGVTKSTRMLPRIANRMFNTPLMVHEGKLNTIMNVVGGRAGIDPTMLANLLIEEDDPDTNWQDRGDKRYRVTEDGIAVIPVYGTLVHRGMDLDNTSGMTSYEVIDAKFQEALADDGVKAIAFDFDSPGGEVNGLFDLVDDIYEARGQKPMWAIVNDMAYSAAYALATATDKIVCSRSAGVGSVGVVLVHADLSAADHMRGIRYSLLHEGKRKVDGNDMGPLSQEAREELEGELKAHYNEFVNTVSRNLGIDKETVKGTEARAFGSHRAKDLGMAHEVKRIKTAYAELGKIAKGEASVEKEPPEPGETGIQTMLFDKSIWNQSDAEQWLRDHDMEVPEVDETENMYRYRQFDPDNCDPDTYSTLTEDFPEGVKAVVCTAKSAKSASARTQKSSSMTVEVKMSDEMKAFREEIRSLVQNLDTGIKQVAKEEPLDDEVEIVDDESSANGDEEQVTVDYNTLKSLITEEINKLRGRVD